MRYSDSNKTIGKALQAARKKAGYKSAREFAEVLGINLNTYTDIEQGKSGLTFERAWQIADVLDCTLDEVGGREPPPRNQRFADSDKQAMCDAYDRLDRHLKGAASAAVQAMAAGDGQEASASVASAA